MKDAIISRLRESGNATVLTGAGLEYVIRPAKDVPLGTLVEVHRADQMDIRSLADVTRWGRLVGMTLRSKPQ